MSDATNEHRAIRVRARDHDGYDDQIDEVNVVDEQDDDFELDVDNDRKRNGFHRLNVDDIGCCTTEV